MVRFGEWREAIDPERPLERFDVVSHVGVSFAVTLVTAICCACLAPPVLWWTWKAMEKAFRIRRVARLRDIPPVQLQIASRLTLEWGSTTYGCDEGIVSLVDGAILFEGRRTSFCVRRSDINLEHLSHKGFSFRFLTPAGDCRAIVHAAEQDEMRAAINLWSPREGRGIEVSVFPPFHPDQSLWKRIEIFRILLVSTGFLGVLLYLQWAAATDPAVGLVFFVWVGGWALLERKRRRLLRLQQTPLPMARTDEAGNRPH